MSRALLGLALAVRFGCEIGAVVAAAVWGADVTNGALSVVVAVAAALAVCAVWGLWVAPKSPRRLADPGRACVELVVFGAAVAALCVTGHVGWGVALAVAAVVSAAVSRALGGEERFNASLQH